MGWGEGRRDRFAVQTAMKPQRTYLAATRAQEVHKAHAPAQSGTAVRLSGSKQRFDQMLLLRLLQGGSTRDAS